MGQAYRLGKEGIYFGDILSPPQEVNVGGGGEEGQN